ncbi:hypothetical protein C0989_012147 [Termitomyces sp. Mn162]|nr:hypothetical protein C0989_012147 [Termitomyces sp. Mn162]
MDILLIPSTNDPASAPSVPVSSLLDAEPMEPIDASDAADAGIQKVLSYLAELSVLQHNNQMNINELLNPINEDKMYEDRTEEEIEKDIFFSAVVECHKAEQNREKKGEDAVDHEVINDKPSH